MLASVALGLVAGAVAARLLVWQAAELIGWDVAATTFLLSVWLTIAHLDAEETGRRARIEDTSVAIADLVILFAGVACIVGAGFALMLAGSSKGGKEAYLIALAVASVVVSWASVHTVFTLRYARLFYGPANGGVNFNAKEPPDYLDFAYLAFTVGMTFQVSDTNLTVATIRHTVLRQALLSYLFGAVIIGLTINVVASLLK